MKLIRIGGQLSVDGTNARMKLLLEKIKQTEDRKTLNLLNRAWWKAFFAQEKELRKAA